MAEQPPPGKIHTSDPSRAFKQDLPPKGGYRPINFTRIPARQIVNGPMLFGGFLLLQTYGIYHYLYHKKVWMRNLVENTSTRLEARQAVLNS